MIILTNKVRGLMGAIRSVSLYFCLATTSIALLMSAPAYAGTVSGEVKEAGKKLTEAEIEVKDSRNNRFLIKTNKTGEFKVNLPPGIYKATNKKDKSKSVLIQSSPQPSRQDLNFGGR